MAAPPRPTHPLVAVLAAGLAIASFALSSLFDHFVHGLILGIGIGLLGVAIVLVTGTRQGAPGHGWLPSQDADGPTESGPTSDRGDS